MVGRFRYNEVLDEGLKLFEDIYKKSYFSLIVSRGNARF